jgi:hypothetical protein
VRDGEPDLRAALRVRAAREQGAVRRIGNDATVIAVIERLLPGSAVPSSVLAAFVDERFDQPLGRADDRLGLLPREELLPAGFAALEAAAGEPFASLHAGAQDALLALAERGELRGPQGFDSSIWFSRLRDLVLLAYGSDPRGMVQMGYPGPSYQPGHLWLDQSGVEARASRKRGYQRF